VVEVPYTLMAGEVFVTQAFHRTAARLRDHEGYILPKLLRQVPGKIRSIALVSFSGGTGFVADVLRGPDALNVDTVIVLDGIHLAKNWQGSVIPQAAAPWLEYGRGAAVGTHNLLVGHTNIAAPVKSVTSTQESSLYLWQQLQAMDIQPAPKLVLPSASVLGSALDQAAKSYLPLRLKIGSNQQVYNGLGIQDMIKVGSALTVDIGGKRNIDHEFASKVLQGSFIKAVLQPRWNGEAVVCPTSTSGLGAPAECVRRLVTVTDRYQQKGHTFSPVVAALLGGAAGVAGYYLSRRML